MNIIDKYQHNQEGYNPCLITGKWQVAFLNYNKDESLSAITKLDIHHHTDEAFIILKGRSILIAADIKEHIIEYDVTDMQQGLIYNIRKNVWHKIAMEEGSQVLIIENENTHKNDFEFYDLDEKQIQQLRKIVNDCKMG